MRLSREQSRSLARWVRKHHPQSVVGEEGDAVAELEELGFAVRGDECVEWGAGKSEGYGAVNLPNRKSVRIHRAMREILDSEPPNQVLHRCGNKPCFNLDHTYSGDQSNNTLDMYRLGETSNIGETSHLAKLTRAQVDDIRARYIKGNRWHPGNGAELMTEYGLSQSNLSNITTGRSWRN